MSRTNPKNPFKTDKTTISAATPSVMPITDIPVILEIKDTERGLNRYRRAMRNLKFNVAVAPKRDEYTLARLEERASWFLN